MAPAKAVAAPIALAGVDWMVFDGNVSAAFKESSIALSIASPVRGQRCGLAWKPMGARVVKPVAENPLPGKLHDLRGSRDQWQIDQTTYGRVRYAEIYPGIDLMVESRPSGLKYTFEVKSGADPRAIRLSYEGAREVRRSGNGLEIETELGVVRESGLVCYQEIGDRRRDVRAEYTVGEAGQYSISVGDYDETRPLILDPVIDWSTFVGGISAQSQNIEEKGVAAAVAPTGEIVLLMDTRAPELPRVGGLDFGPGGRSDHRYLVKFDASGTQILWATYVPGSLYDIALDAAGNVFLAGSAGLLTLPAGVPTLRLGGTEEGSEDVLLAKLSADGSRLEWATVMGGPRRDVAYALAVDSAGFIVLTGHTDGGFPHVSALYRTEQWADAFVAKFSPDGSPLWTSYLGGNSSAERALDVAVDARGDVYVGGETRSWDFPVTPGALKTTFQAEFEGFVTKFSADGSRLIWSTFVGGQGGDAVLGLAVAPNGTVWTTGYTYSTDLPSPVRSPSGWGDAYLLGLSADGTRSVACTYLSGTGLDEGRKVVVDSSGNVWVVGQTRSTDFPVSDSSAFTGGQHAFVAKLSPAAGLLWSRYLGGSADEFVSTVVADGQGAVHVVGTTMSSDFPTVNAFDSTLSAPADLFWTKLNSVGATILSTLFGGEGTTVSEDPCREMAVVVRQSWTRG